MNVINAGRRMVVCLIALGLVMSVVTVAEGATFTGAFQKQGGVRMHGSAGQTVRVTVMLNGKILTSAGAAVTVTASNGATVTSGHTTGGWFSTPLDAGTYTVTATTLHYTATGSVTTEQSTSTAALTLNLVPKTATH
jgi:hypothetical protein